jgi:hypothetical protein
MTAVSTTEAGMCVALADVCQVPSAAGPVPTPFVNVAQCMDADGSTTSQRVKVGGRAVITASTEIARSSGDEPGVGGGVVSGTFMGPVRYRAGSPKVVVEGSEVVTHLAQTSHNGTNANAPCGAQVTPSQTKVLAR